MRSEDHDDELPCWVALLACSLALMTSHASPEPTARVAADALRRLTARKIVSNLFFLQHHPHAPPGLRRVVANVRAAWLPLAQGAQEGQDGQEGQPGHARFAAPQDGRIARQTRHRR